MSLRTVAVVVGLCAFAGAGTSGAAPGVPDVGVSYNFHCTTDHDGGRSVIMDVFVANHGTGPAVGVTTQGYYAGSTFSRTDATIEPGQTIHHEIPFAMQLLSWSPAGVVSFGAADGNWANNVSFYPFTYPGTGGC